MEERVTRRRLGERGRRRMRIIGRKVTQSRRGVKSRNTCGEGKDEWNPSHPCTAIFLNSMRVPAKIPATHACQIRICFITCKETNVLLVLKQPVFCKMSENIYNFENMQKIKPGHINCEVNLCNNRLLFT